jgi:hypothetical protein
MAMTKGNEDGRAGPGFAVFSSHSRNAHEKAKEVFIRNFGADSWNRHIQPFEDQGALAVFSAPPTFHTMFYVAAVTMLVNGDVEVGEHIMSERERAALTAWDQAAAEAHGGTARDKPLLTAARLIVAGDALAQAVRGYLPRPRLYGLTAEDWLHLASEGEASEVAPCCASIGAIRDLLNALATEQDPESPGLRWSLGTRLLEAVEADGSQHELDDERDFPLLHRVLSGVAAELRERDEQYGRPSP